MTYLQLVQRTRQECGIAGDGPTTVVGQTREMKRLCDWVAQSWVEIQEERQDWDFMRKSVTFNTSSGTTQSAGSVLAVGSVYRITYRNPADFTNGVYTGAVDFGAYGYLQAGTANNVGAVYLIATALTLTGSDTTILLGKQSYSLTDIGITDFASWRNDSFRQYLQSAGVATEIILSQYYNYSEFRDFYLLGSRKLVTGRPLYVTIAPDRSLLFGFTPNDIYVTNAEYYRTPQELTLDADEPLMPSRFHMAIVYKAMQKYGAFEVAQEQIAAGKEGYAMMINRLRQEYTPMVQATGSFL